MKKQWETPTVTERDMTPDDYQRMNDILIAQASENEIYIAGLLEHIRDLEAEPIIFMCGYCRAEMATHKLGRTVCANCGRVMVISLLIQPENTEVGLKP